MPLIVKLMSHPSPFQDDNVAMVSHSYPAGSHIPRTHSWGIGVAETLILMTIPSLLVIFSARAFQIIFLFIEIVSIKGPSVDLDIHSKQFYLCAVNNTYER